MTEDIGRLCDTFVAAWDAAAPDATFDGPAFTPAAQARNEGELAAFVDVLEGESHRVRRRITQTGASEQRVLSAFAKLAVRTLGWPRRCFDQGPSDGFREALRAFPVEARRFDPELSSTDIYQAARNALTMCCLQSLLGVAVELTPSLLGYSLLYPYTDNLLDDPHLDTASKLAFGRRLGIDSGAATSPPSALASRASSPSWRRSRASGRAGVTRESSTAWWPFTTPSSAAWR